jgi:trk system potassium uptake protein TrkH
VTVEMALTAILTLQFRFAYDESWGRAVWHGLFHAVSAFNNAGFSTYSDNLMGFVVDPLIVIPIMVAIVLGGLGFPVLYELRRDLRRPSRWSVHTKITMTATGLLLIGGFVAILWSEWTNPATLGLLGTGGKLLASAFHSVSARTAGFNTLDVGAFTPETIVVNDMLMFIGGGSAGTAGGIKVTTFFLLAFVIWAEIRGDPDTTAFGRRIPVGAQRQALTVALLGVAFVVLGALALLTLTDFQLSDVLFEVVSAFGTVGLSTGITPDLPPAAQGVVIVLMFVGRVGSITVATALALRSRSRLYRLPEERPIVG